MLKKDDGQLLLWLRPSSSSSLDRLLLSASLPSLPHLHFLAFPDANVYGLVGGCWVAWRDGEVYATADQDRRPVGGMSVFVPVKSGLASLLLT